MQVIDTHSHLEEIGDLGGAIERARRAGVIAIVAVGSDFDSDNRVLQIAADYPGYVFPALGLHPANLASGAVRALRFIEENIHSAVAIGEVGLDYHKRVIGSGSPRDLQKAVLGDILALARRYAKPVIVHSRYAWRDCFELVQGTGVDRAVFHWFTGPTSVLSRIAQAGYMVSATPAAEYHQEHRRAVKAVDVQKILLETDSPVSYGMDARWQAEPADTIRSLRAAAQTRDTGVEELAKTTTENAVRFFGLTLGVKGGGDERQTL